MRLGLTNDAAHIVQRMPSLPGHDSEDVNYARARLLWGLGDFTTAHRIVGAAFRETLKGLPNPRTRRYFQLAYPAAYPDLVGASAGEFKISPLLILALMRQESAYDHNARSWASANGLMQIIPSTGEKIAARLDMPAYNYGVLREPSVNVRFGSWYLSELLRKFNGNIALAIGSYNAGPVAVSAWVDQRHNSATDEFIEDIPYRETRHYVKRVLGNLAVYTYVYRGKPLHIPEQIPDSYLDNVDF